MAIENQDQNHDKKICQYGELQNSAIKKVIPLIVTTSNLTIYNKSMILYLMLNSCSPLVDCIGCFWIICLVL